MPSVCLLIWRFSFTLRAATLRSFGEKKKGGYSRSDIKQLV